MQNGTSHGLCTCTENAAPKQGMTLGTHIGRTSNWPAVRCCGTRVESDAYRDQWASDPYREAPMVPGRSCSETKKCGHTVSIPPPKPKRLRSSRAAGAPRSCTWYRASVKCRVLFQAGHTPGAWRVKIAWKKIRDPQDPHRPDARPGRHWLRCDWHTEPR